MADVLQNIFLNVFTGDKPLSELMVAYRQTFNISCALEDNYLADLSHVVGALPVGAAPTTLTSSFSTEHLASVYCTMTTARRDETHLSFRIRCRLY